MINRKKPVFVYEDGGKKAEGELIARRPAAAGRAVPGANARVIETFKSLITWD